MRESRLNSNCFMPLRHCAAALVLLAIFVAYCIAVFEYGFLASANQAVHGVARQLYQPEVKDFLILITFAGKYYVLLPMISFTMLWFWRRGDYWTAIHGLVLALIVAGTSYVLKFFIDSPRPGGILVSPSGNSFPSAHSSLSFAFWLFLSVILAQKLPRHKRGYVYATTLIVASIIGISRLYLSAHWLSDVLGGALLGVTCCLLVSVSYLCRPRIDFPAKIYLSVIGLSFVIPWLVYLVLSYAQARENYTAVWRSNFDAPYATLVDSQ